MKTRAFRCVSLMLIYSSFDFFFPPRAFAKLDEARSLEDADLGHYSFAEAMTARRQMVQKQFWQASNAIDDLNQMLQRNQVMVVVIIMTMSLLLFLAKINSNNDETPRGFLISLYFFFVPI